MWGLIERRSGARSFLPTAAMTHVILLLATGRQTDPASILAASILVPLTAFGIHLVFQPSMRAIFSPQRVAFKMSRRMVKAISGHVGLSGRQRQKLTDLLVPRYQPLVSEQIEEFWAERSKDDALDRDLRIRETRIMSLVILGSTFVVSAFALWFRVGIQPTVPSTLPPPEVWFGMLLFVLAIVLSVAFGSERRLYRRVMWEKVPLLMALDASSDSTYWKERKEFYRDRQGRLGDQAADELVNRAELNMALALKGEIEREWIELRVAREVGMDVNTVRLLLNAVSSAEQESTTSPISVIHAVVVAASASLISTAIVVLASPQEFPPLYSFLFVVGASFVSAFVFMPYVARLIRSRRVFKDMAGTISKDLEKNRRSRKYGEEMIERVKGLRNESTEREPTRPSQKD